MSAEESLRSLVKRAQEAKAEAARLEENVRTTEETLKARRAPYEKELEAVRLRMDLDRSVSRARLDHELAQNARWETRPHPLDVGKSPVYASTAAEILEHEVERRKALRSVPWTEEQFQSFLRAGAFPGGGRVYGVTTRKPTACGAYVILSASEDGGDKFYLAVAGDPDAKAHGTSPLSIAGWLRVTPSTNRGETTSAMGLVRGRPFLRPRVFLWSTDQTRAPREEDHSARKPLAQFKAALEGRALTDEEMNR